MMMQLMIRKKASQDEITTLEQNNTWVEVPISEAKGAILPGMWVFRRKRTPDGTIKKYKGRYCVRGDLQKGDFETFAPVVAFSTVRLFLILSIILGWKSCSIDFSNAFVHGELIIGSKDGENFTYMYSENLDSGVEVYFLSDDPQTTVHIEFISKY